MLVYDPNTPIRIILIAAIFALPGMNVLAGDPTVGPGDILRIEVYDEPALSLQLVVSASGEFSYPLLRRVVASGHTAHSLAREMEQRLSDEQYLRYPSVNVVIVEQRSSVVTLSGAVNNPGRIHLCLRPVFESSWRTTEGS